MGLLLADHVYLPLFRHAFASAGRGFLWFGTAEVGIWVYLRIIDNSLLEPAYVDQLQTSTLTGNPVCG